MESDPYDLWKGRAFYKNAAALVKEIRSAAMPGTGFASSGYGAARRAAGVALLVSSPLSFEELPGGDTGRDTRASWRGPARRGRRDPRAASTPRCALIRQVAEYIVGGGGKRLRPAAAAALGRRVRLSRARTTTSSPRWSSSSTPRRCCTTTSWTSPNLRRGRATANALFGNAAAVLVGDFVYSRAFQMMVERRQHARAAGAGRRDQRHRRGRGDAAHELPQPRRRRGRLPRGDPLQDGEAVRGRHAAGRDPGRRAARRRRTRSPTTACTWAPRSS